MKYFQTQNAAQYDATLPPEKKVVLPYNHSVLYSRPNLIRLQEPQMLYLMLDLEAPLKGASISRAAIECLSGARSFHIHAR